MKTQVLPRVKICGLTRSEDVDLAVSLGAWALGFIFYKASPRATTPENVAKITGRAGGAKRVGVFVNATADYIAATVGISGIDVVQLHGDETPEFCRDLKTRLARVELIKALRPRTHEDLGVLAHYSQVCEAILLDAYVPGEPGGTGVTGDWALAAEAAASHALHTGEPRIILAGGLNPNNIQSALKILGLFAVDVSSGLEESPGIKSTTRMKEFFLNAAKVERSA